MPTPADLLALALDKNPVDFASAFDEIIREKTVDAIEAKKTEIAQSIYGDDSSDLDDDDVDVDTDGEIDDDLGIDLDDIDLDLDDLDLELEDNTNAEES